jgi:hypothetical protein
MAKLQENGNKNWENNCKRNWNKFGSNINRESCWRRIKKDLEERISFRIKEGEKPK